MRNWNDNHGLGAGTTATGNTRTQQLNVGLAAALLAIASMVLGTTPGLIAALDRVELPSLQGAASAPEHAKAGPSTFRADGDVLRVRNRAAGITAAVGRESLSVRASSGGPAVTLRTTSLSRPGHTVALKATAAPLATDSTATITRGAAIEWFQNRATSLQQGWTVPRKVAGAGVLSLGLAIKGASVEVAGRHGLTLAPAAGRSISYGNLVVRDAKGAKLPAHFALTGSGARIVVDDRRATYPIVIDPDIAAVETLSPPPTASSNQFGTAVEVTGNWMAVKEPGYRSDSTRANAGVVRTGRIQLFHDTTGNGNWTPVTTIVPDTGASFQNGGLSLLVEPAGVTVLALTATVPVGVQVWTLAGDPEGAALTATPTLIQTVTAQDISGLTITTPTAMAADGDLLVMGMPSSTTPGIRDDANGDGVLEALNELVGTGQVFRRTGGFGATYAFESRIDPAGGLGTPESTRDVLQRFGTSLAVDAAHGLIAVGTPGDDGVRTPTGGSATAPAPLGTSTNNGAINVFKFNAGSWSLAQRLAPAGLPSGAMLGNSVTFAGTSGGILGGAPLEGGNVGAGYLYDWDGTSTWTQVQRVSAADDPTTSPTNEATATSQLGTSVAADPNGTHFYLGAISYPGPTNLGGAVLAYKRASASGPVTQVATLRPPSPTDPHGGLSSLMGSSVAARNNLVVAGQPTFGTSVETRVGRVSPFVRSGDTYTALTELSPDLDPATDGYGTAVSQDGDLLAISAHNSIRSAFGRGAVFVYHRDAAQDKWVYEATLVPTGAFPSDGTGTSLWGTSVAIRVVRNPDGSEQGAVVAVGVPGDSGLNVDGLSSTPDVNVNEAGSVAIYQRNAGTSSAWNIGTEVWAGGRMGTQAAPGSTAGAHPLGHFGWSVAITRDGTIVVGEPGAPNGGAIHRYDRTAAGATDWTDRETIVQGSANASGFGRSVAVDGSTVLAMDTAGNGVWRYTDGNATTNLAATDHYAMNLVADLGIGQNAGLSVSGNRFAVNGKDNGTPATRVYRVVNGVAVREAEFSQAGCCGFFSTVDLNHGGTGAPTVVVGKTLTQTGYDGNPGGHAKIYVAKVKSDGSAKWSFHGYLTQPAADQDIDTNNGYAVTNWPANGGALVSSPTAHPTAGFKSGAVYRFPTAGITPPPGPQAFVDVSVAPTVKVGANALRTSTLPNSLLANNATTGGAIAATPIGSIDLSQAPRGTAISASPMSSIPMSSIPMSSIPMSSIPLSSIPLTGVPGGWEQLLANTAFAGLPLQSIMLKDVYDLPTVQALTLGQLSLAGSPMSSIPMSSIALGATKLSDIQLDTSSSDPAIKQWCDALKAAKADTHALGMDCDHPDASHNADVTVLSIGMKGAPMSSIPMSSIPMSSIPMSSIPMSSIPMSSITLAGTPMSSIPMSSIDIGSTPMSSIPMSSIPMSSIPMSSIPMSSITLAGTPMSSIPMSSINIAGTPMSSIPMSSIPMSSIPMSSIPMSSIPMSSIPMSSIPMSSIILGGLPMSSIPMSSIDIGSTPMSSIPMSSIPMSSIPMSSIPMSSIPMSSIPMSSIPMSSITIDGTPMSSIPMSSIPMSSIPMSSIKLADLPAAQRDHLVDCAQINCATATLGQAVAAGALKPGGTLGDLQGHLAGVRWSVLIGAGGITAGQLRSALGNRTLADLDGFDDLTLGELSQIWPYLTLGQLQSQLGGVRLDDVARNLKEFTANQVQQALADSNLKLAALTGWDTVTLGQVTTLLQYLHLTDLSASLGKLRLGDLISAIAKPGGGTYSEAELRSALNQAMPNATLGDLDDFGNLTLGELGQYGDLTLGQLFEALTQTQAGKITLGDVLLALINPKQYPWESLDLSAVTAQAFDTTPTGTPVTVAYRADAPDGLPRTVQVTVQVPRGSRVEAGSTTGDGSAAERAPLVDGDTATWTFQDVPAGAVRNLQFVLNAPVTIGPAQLKATAFLPADDETDTDTAGTIVEEAFEPNDTLASATPLEDDTITLSHVSHAGDVDVFKFDVSAPGTRVSISLSNLDADLDATLYAAREGTIVATSGKSLVPVDDTEGSGLPGATQSGAVVTEAARGDDVAKPSDLGNLAAVQGSYNRGRANEQIDTGVLTRTGTYYLAVTGYNGAVDVQPYALRLKRFVTNTQPSCPARAVTSGTVGTQLPGALPSGTDTVFVLNRSRMEGLYGAAATDTLVQQLNAFVSWAGGQDGVGVHAAVLNVDADPAVRSAYAAWDASPCLPSGANGVTSEVARLLNGYRSAGSQLKNVVIVGGDDVVPFGRVPDRTKVANESGYASTFSDAGNALYATFATSSVQSDDPYVDRSAYAFGDRTLYVPDAVVARMVESPTEIGDQFADFRAADGKLAVGTGLVTGYDFLSDGANQIKDELGDTFGSVNSSLIRDDWTRQDLEDAIATIKPDLLSVNAHFDHFRALPGKGNRDHDESDLFTAAAVRGSLAEDLAGSIVFSMGCHGGLSASDKLLSAAGDERALDFAQAVSSQGGIFVGNTGFGYGDTETVALSELLMAQFADRLDGSMSVGEALLYAKNAYFSSLAEYTPYDEKVLQQTTFYGLPFYRLDVPNPPSSPAPVSPVLAPDASTGLQVTTTHLEPTHVNRTAENGTSYVAAIDPVTGKDSLTTVQNRPVQPKVDREFALPAGLAAHDALVLGLTSVDTANTDPYIFQPIVDDSGEQTDVGVNTAFPTRAVRVNPGLSPAGGTFHIAATTGYFRTTAPDGKGLQRTYKSMDVLTYLPPAGNDDYLAPTFSQVTGSVHDGVLSVSAHTLDDRGDASRVKRVRLLLLQDPRNGAATTWRGIDLVRTGGSDEWTGSLPTTGRNLEFLLQAVDAAGNVGVTTDKAENFSDDGAVGGSVNDPTDGGGGSPVGDLELQLSGQQGANGWYTNPVTVTATGGVRLVYEVVGEREPTGYQEPFQVTGTGLHTVRVTSADGQTRQVTVAIDTVGPVATLISPAPGQTMPAATGALISYSCPDAGSGATTCSGTVDGSTVLSGSTLFLAPGTHTVVVTAGPDLAGNPASVPTVVRTFTVLGGPATVGAISVSKAQDGATTTLTIPFTGYSALTYSGTVSWGDGGSTNCAMAGSGCTITRNSAGGGTLTVTHTYNPAWVDTTATVTVVDNLGQSASATVKVNKKTTLVATAALLQLKISTNVVELKSGAISATLKDGAGNPLAGQAVKFTLPSGATICTATTNSAGVAGCPTTLTYTLAMLLAGKYYATFAGKDAYHGSTDSASLIG